MPQKKRPFNKSQLPYNHIGDVTLKKIRSEPKIPEMKSAYKQLKALERQAVDCMVETDSWFEMTALMFPTLDPKMASKKGMEFIQRPLVQAAIAERTQEDIDRYYVTNKRIVDELSKIAFGSIGNYFRIGDNGEPVIDLSNCTKAEISALSEMTVEDYVEGRGKNARDVRRIKIKMHDKLASIDKLMKHLQMFAPERFEISGKDGKPIQQVIECKMSDADAAAAYALTLENVNYTTKGE